MSLLVHGLFFLLLLFSVSWHSQPHPQVEAELWNVLPEPPAPIPLPTLPPPQPEPAKPEPVKAAVAQPAKPDIALERAEKKRREQEALKQAALRQQEEAKQEEIRHKAEEQARIDKEKADKATQAEKLRQEQQRDQARREAARKQVEQEIARQAREELNDEDAQLRGAEGAAYSRSSQINDAKDRIRIRIHAYLRLPPTLVGNPEAQFQVSLLPNGEVLRAVLIQSSGQAAYDHEVERAILKASPLPLPADRDAANAFREGLILKFRPHEDGAGVL